MPPDPVLVGSAAHLFVDDLENPTISPSDMHHLLRSLRLRDGEKVSVSDGAGSWRLTTFRARRSGARRGLTAGDPLEEESRSKVVGSAVLEPDGPIVRTGRPQVTVSVAFALTGAAAARDVVQRLTEVGVDSIVPLVCDRTGGNWPPSRAATLVEGLGKVVREAAMQARRVVVPELRDVASFAEVAGSWTDCGMLADPRGDRLPAAGNERWAVMIGPEGGWSPGEIACGLPRVSLAGGVLRAGTAAVVAGAYLVERRSHLLECHVEQVVFSHSR